MVYRAVNYLDRFLSVMKVSPQYLEGISWVCYFLAESVGDNRNVSFPYVFYFCSVFINSIKFVNTLRILLIWR